MFAKWLLTGCLFMCSVLVRWMAAELTVCVRTVWPFRTKPPAQSISTCPSTARKVSWLQNISSTPPLLSDYWPHSWLQVLLFQEEKVVMLYFSVTGSVLCWAVYVFILCRLMSPHKTIKLAIDHKSIMVLSLEMHTLMKNNGIYRCRF